MIIENIYNFKLKNCVYLDYDFYSRQVWYTLVNMYNWLSLYTTGDCQKLWTAYLFRRSYEIFSAWILCKVSISSQFLCSKHYISM